jgi:hypothetical protein
VRKAIAAILIFLVATTGCSKKLVPPATIPQTKGVNTQEVVVNKEITLTPQPGMFSECTTTQLVLLSTFGIIMVAFLGVVACKGIMSAHRWYYTRANMQINKNVDNPQASMPSPEKTQKVPSPELKKTHVGGVLKVPKSRGKTETKGCEVQ